MYLKLWVIEVMHREIKQDGLGKIYQQVFAGIVSTTKMSLLAELLIKISAMISLVTQIMIGKETPGLIYKSMALRLSQDLFLVLENMGPRPLDAILESIGKAYTSTIGAMGGQKGKL